MPKSDLIYFEYLKNHVSPLTHWVMLKKPFQSQSVIDKENAKEHSKIIVYTLFTCTYYLVIRVFLPAETLHSF